MSPDKESVEFVCWMAQTVHQAYHTEHEGTWHTCPKDVCVSASRWLVDTSVKVLKMQQNMSVIDSHVRTYRNMFQALKGFLTKLANHTKDQYILTEINRLATSMEAHIDYQALSLEERTAAILRYGSPEAWFAERGVVSEGWDDG